jgi:RluA family pseudouridine synthase
MKIKPENMVIYQDDDLLVINKPSGLLTLPDGYKPELPHVKSILEPVFGALWIAHRLDRETSGVLVLARTAQAHRILNTQFETRAAGKVYHALVKGSPEWDELRVNLPLLPDGDREHRTVVDHRRGKPSATGLRVLERYPLYTLLEARPETGRTHQIRAHLAATGFPIAGDGVYGEGEPVFLSEIKADYRSGKGEERPLLARLGLHAWSIEIEHPASGEMQRFQAPYVKDFGAVINQLRKRLKV